MKRTLLTAFNGLIVFLVALSSLAFSEEPEKVSACRLKSDPAAFDHKLVQLTSFLSHGFEDFTLQDPTCNMWLDIWVEYGGKAASGTVYCCGGAGERSRPKELVVEKIPIPLVEDNNFRTLDDLLRTSRGYTMAHASLIGRFFAGKEMSYEKGKYWGGYGHMGCCSLFVVQQVLSVDPHDRNDLDYESYVDLLELNKPECATYQDLTPIENYDALLAAQKHAEDQGPGWAFEDPRRVATSGLAKILKVDEESIAPVAEIRTSQGKVIYEWHSKSKTTYLAVVTRPYWLSFYSKDHNRVAWVLASARRCGG